MKQIGNISESLTPPHRIAVLSSFGHKIKTMTSEELTKPLILILSESYETLGQKTNESIVSTVKLLRIELMTYFTTFTLEEISTAVKMGVTGKLCDLSSLPMPIVSVTNICKFIHLYNEKVRREALHEQRKFEEKENIEMENQKRIKAELELDQEIQICYENYKSNPETLSHVDKGLLACYFRFLWKKTGKKIMPPDAIDQIKIIAESKVDTFEELSKLDQKVLERNREVAKFDRERKATVKIEAEAMGLKYIFDNLKEA